MFTSIRARIISAAAGCLMVALILNTLINLQVTRLDNQQTQQETLRSTSASHGQGIRDWGNSKMSMITSLQQIALDSDPVPAFKLLAQAGGFTNVYAGYADKTARFSDSNGIPADYDPTSRMWYQQTASSNAPVITEPYLDVATKKLVVTFAAPLTENGELKGVVAGDLSMDTVVDNVRGIRPTPESSGLLVDGNGTIIAAGDSALTMKNFSSAVTGLTFKQLVNGEAQTGSLAGVDKSFLASRVEGTPWWLVIALDESDATSGMVAQLKASLLSLLFLVLIGGAIVHLIVTRLMKRLSQIRDALRNIASGTNDLSQRLPDSGNDEVAQIAGAFNAFCDKLSVVMVQLREASGSVKIAAQEIASGNQDLSVRTEQAASSLRGTACAVEQITASVSQSTESAAEANDQAQKASQAATRGGDVVTQAISTMKSIEEASAKIGDITSVIDGIAFQTNILALNASVEAARAGEQGRGFAVVAGEVRNLASRSAQAAREIKTLIDSTTESVATGSRYVHLAGESMKEIVLSISNASGIMREINIASSEQMQGIQEINNAISHLDRMVQQNAELVVESAAAADALQGQAGELAETAGHFRI
ncbi:methyl-accepting chemotaxis protein [Citrobacter sp. RHB25-C09]|uniref:methyl-accepting chemotaxis protein n=1 Tax=Citrobacter sp. RHB25-C09 TaxID=2742624 RepID=UPI0015EF64A3|nr:methyl-accepting chemotaxis protein [Citrobacter sp. RHB25-C09]QMI05377.1 HAMP domain-containing protein [Citrobacter sp. RHB25-C09]